MEGIELTAKQIAQMVHGTIDGDENTKVNKFIKIDSQEEGGLAFVGDSKYAPFIYQSKASVIIVYQSFQPEQPIHCTLIRVKNPQLEFVHLMQYYASLKEEKIGISPKAHIAKSAKIGLGVYIGEGAVIGENVEIGDDAKIYPQVYVGDKAKIGEDSILYAGVKIYHECIVGNNCILHAGCVIGADGFGFIPNEDGVYEKIPQLGNVVIEDDVEIGANSCIDRAMMGSTIIHHGVKIDNLNQIAHNCEIGHDTVIAACCGIAGSVHIGSHCVFAGQVGVKDHVKIGDQVTVGSQAGIHKNAADKQTLLGSPAMDGKKMLKIFAAMNFLPQLIEEKLNK